MLSDAELATIRAALRFWNDEIVPGGKYLSTPYFDEPVEEALNREAIEALIGCFHPSEVGVVQATPEGISISSSNFQSEIDRAPKIGTIIFGHDRNDVG